MKIIQIINEEIPKGAVVEIDGNKFRWLGAQWKNVATNKLASKAENKKINALPTVKELRASNKVGNLSIDNKTVSSQMVGKDKFVVTFQETENGKKVNRSVRFKDPKLAAGVAKSIREGMTFKQASKVLPKDSYKILNVGKLMTSFNIGRSMSKSQIDAYIDKIKAKGKNAPGASRFLTIVNGKMWQALGRFGGFAGFQYLLYQTFVINYDQVLTAPEDSFESPEGRQELLDVITGLYSTQVILGIVAILRSAKLTKSFINLLRAPVRAFQAGALVTGAGTVPAIITAIVTEGAFFVALYALSNPTVQMELAKYIASTSSGSFFIGGLGNLANSSMQVLDSLTNGALGGESLRDAIGFKKGVTKMPAGTAWASSEWAKLAFQDMIFPPDMEKIKVPYLSPERRRNAIFIALEMKAPTSTTNQPAPGPGDPSVPGLPTNPDAPAGPQ